VASRATYLPEIRYPVGKPPESDKETQVMDYLPYVRRTVQRLAVHLPLHVELEDLMSAGIIGLIEALDRYDPKSGNQFLTYASFRIRGAVLSELRARDFLSRTDRRRIKEMQKTEQALERELGRHPEDAELARAMGMDMEEYFAVRRVSDVTLVNFDDLGVASDSARSFLDTLTDEKALDALTMTRLKELTQSVSEAIDDLNEKEKLVVSMYYQDELTMKEIGHVLDITESRVSQIHSKAVQKVRATLKRTGMIEN